MTHHNGKEAIILFFRCWLVFLIGTVQADPQPLQRAVEVGYGEWPPYQSESLPQLGSINQVIRMAFEHSGVDTSFKAYPWARGLELVFAGNIEIMSVGKITPERERYTLLTNPVIDVRKVVFHSVSKTLNFRHAEDLMPLQVAC